MQASNETKYPRLFQALLLLMLLLFIRLVTALLVATLMAFFMGVESEADYAKVTNSGLLGWLITALEFSILGGGIVYALKRIQLPAKNTLAIRPFPPSLLPGILFTALGLMVLCSEVDNIIRYFYPLPEEITEIGIPVFEQPLLGLIALVILAPIFEEFLFRGIVLRGLLFRYPKWRAILISALLFAFFHVNAYQIFGALATGLFLGWLYFRSKSIWPPVIAHASYNGIAWLALGALKIEIPGFSTDITSQEVIFQPLWFNLIGLMAFGAGLYSLMEIFRRRDEAHARQRHPARYWR